MTEETRCHPATGAALATLLIETTVAGQAGGTRAASPIRAALKIHPLSGGGGRFRARGGCANVRHPPDQIAS
jgi:hypothetical protein